MLAGSLRSAISKVSCEPSLTRTRRVIILIMSMSNIMLIRKPETTRTASSALMSKGNLAAGVSRLPHASQALTRISKTIPRKLSTSCSQHQGSLLRFSTPKMLPLAHQTSPQARRLLAPPLRTQQQHAPVLCQHPTGTTHGTSSNTTAATTARTLISAPSTAASYPIGTLDSLSLSDCMSSTFVRSIAIGFMALIAFDMG